eukprot:287835_1
MLNQLFIISLSLFSLHTITANYVVPGAEIATTTANTVTANDNRVTIPQDSSGIDINVMENDNDAEGDNFSVISITQPRNGVSTINPDGTVKYTPNTGFCGRDLFEYTIQDDIETAQDTARVAITITCTPTTKPPNTLTANDNSVSVQQDSSIDINVKKNDIDNEYDTFDVVSISRPRYGTAVINDDNTVKYTPNAGYCGIDLFRYTIRDAHGAEDTARVSITIECVTTTTAYVSPPEYSQHKTTEYVAPQYTKPDTTAYVSPPKYTNAEPDTTSAKYTAPESESNGYSNPSNNYHSKSKGSKGSKGYNGASHNYRSRSKGSKGSKGSNGYKSRSRSKDKKKNQKYNVKDKNSKKPRQINPKGYYTSISCDNRNDCSWSSCGNKPDCRRDPNNYSGKVCWFESYDKFGTCCSYDGQMGECDGGYTCDIIGEDNSYGNIQTTSYSNTETPDNVPTTTQEEILDCSDYVWDTDCGNHRHRKPWQMLNICEKQRYAEAFYKLYQTKDDDNERMSYAFTRQHGDDVASSQAHGSSAFLPWHRAFIWEFETQIRNLGGKFACFALPTWDWTHETEQDNEKDDLYEILSSTLGGEGDDDNNGCVNDDSLFSQSNYIPYNGECLIRRPYSLLQSAPKSVQQMATLIRQNSHYGIDGRENSGFRDRIEAEPHGFAHTLLGGPGGHLSRTSTASDDPIFYLIHSSIDYFWALWQDCHNYDEVARDQIDQYIEVYDCANDYSGKSYGPATLSDTLNFDIIKDKNWYVGASNSLFDAQNIKVQDMHDITEWDVSYEPGDFYNRGMIYRWCENELKHDWFYEENLVDTRRRLAYYAPPESKPETTEYVQPVYQKPDTTEYIAPVYQKPDTTEYVAPQAESTSAQYESRSRSKGSKGSNGYNSPSNDYDSQSKRSKGSKGYNSVSNEYGSRGSKGSKGYDSVSDSSEYKDDYRPRQPVERCPQSVYFSTGRDPNYVSESSCTVNTGSEIYSKQSLTMLDYKQQRRRGNEYESEEERNLKTLREWSRMTCEYNKFSEIKSCERPQYFDDCSGMNINEYTGDIDITLDQLLFKVKTSECLMEKRIMFYDWAKATRKLYSLCNGGFDGFCDDYKVNDNDDTECHVDLPDRSYSFVGKDKYTPKSRKQMEKNKYKS